MKSPDVFERDKYYQKTFQHYEAIRNIKKSLMAGKALLLRDMPQKLRYLNKLGCYNLLLVASLSSTILSASMAFAFIAPRARLIAESQLGAHVYTLTSLLAVK